jgi:hypothetical protein
MYIGNHKDPSDLLTCTKKITDTHHLHLNIKEKDPQKTILAVEGVSVFAIHRSDSSIQTYSLNTSNNFPIHTYFLRHTRFNMAIPVSPLSFILRTVDTNLKQNIISKIDLATGAVKNQKRALDKQLDGFFCTDGLMDFDPVSGHIFYMYYYRNLLVCLDSNLDIVYKSRSIDSNTTAKLKIGEIRASEFFTLSAPPVKVNQAIAICFGFIFIRSGLLSDRENRQHFGKASVIDQYRESDGKYFGSFYIPDFAGYKVNGFRFLGDNIIALQGHYLVAYPCTRDRLFIWHRG